MDADEFWSLIDTSRRGTRGFSEQAAKLESLLHTLPREKVEGFDEAFSEHMVKANRRSLKSVAAELGGGGGDDGFMDVRSWLISRGRRAYFAALRDAESIRAEADDSEDIQFEEFQYVAGRILDEK